LTCCDVYGNEGGDWVGCIADQYGIDGNISEDPFFCEGSLYLSSDSPCLYGPCGQIGAHGQGCFGPHPRIASITDVGNDQGRQVRIRWQRSGHDAPGDTVEITEYALYRRQDEYMRGAGVRTATGGAELTVRPVAGDRVDGWDFIDTVPARGDSIYQMTALTLCDSTMAHGMCWSVFFVSAMTPDPLVFFDSVPDSGYSVDNLAPGPPENFRFESPDLLVWEESDAEDFDYFSLYGSSTPDFASAELISHTIETSFDISGMAHEYYHVTATDFSGNEGEPARVGPASSTPEREAAPKLLSLRPVRPNPGSEMTIAFHLPTAGIVELAVFDASGRRVRLLLSGRREAGRHAVAWTADDDRGTGLAAGVYFLSLRADGAVARRKVAILE
jgi:hypothetical protein